MWPPQHGYRPYYGGRRPRGDYPAAVLLLLSLWQQVERLPVRPPITLALVLAQVVIHLRELLLPQLRHVASQGALVAALGICPARVLRRHEWWRLLGAPLLHLDEWHLFYNMSSFLVKGARLEPTLGAKRAGGSTGVWRSHGRSERLVGSARKAPRRPASLREVGNLAKGPFAASRRGGCEGLGYAETLQNKRFARSLPRCGDPRGKSVDKSRKTRTRQSDLRKDFGWCRTRNDLTGCRGGARTRRRAVRAEALARVHASLRESRSTSAIRDEVRRNPCDS
jgi:hypothetical protein